MTLLPDIHFLFALCVITIINVTDRRTDMLVTQARHVVLEAVVREARGHGPAVECLPPSPNKIFGECITGHLR